MTIANPIPKDASRQLARLQKTKASIRQYIQVVSTANESRTQERRNVFKDITIANNSYEFSVSTVEDLITTRQLSLKGRSRHIGGQITSKDYQKSINALTRLDMEHIKVVQAPAADFAAADQRTRLELPTGIREHFHERYGRGVPLSPGEAHLSRTNSHRRPE